MASAVAGEEEREGSRRKASLKDPEGRVISATTRADATLLLGELHNQILAGHASFADLAAKHSDYSFARLGGDLAPAVVAPKSAHYTAVASPSARLGQLLRRAVDVGGRRKPRANPYTVAYNRGAGPPARAGLVVPRDPTGRDLDDKYVLGEELDRGEFGDTYLCTEAAMGARMACKSISNRKLRTPVDEEDMCREVEIMRHMLPHTNIVSLSSARAASSSTGWSRGATTPSAPPAVTHTIVDVFQALGCTLPTLRHVFAS